MIVEHALLHVRAGEGQAFEAAMRAARPLIAASPGFVAIEVRPAAERADRYLLRVVWTDIAAHRDGFRMSEHYQDWRRLLHGFYEPMPVVEYFGESIV
ncbi:MAG: antibiotic biosynthesis monooxygenase [Sphingomonas sp.]|uniref:antibiotic biosynthesis monooxygenase family protein n=1 Tax=Sphingomonas sp. TaxID=28214 RepID=UPI002275FC51|nr:antibiotic biosynthesis monooxygenase [Sphingomonas sp.]MCX8474393.1 antibiotic biosynthesis monooxygenase [Sphingomonas sp.]